MRHQFLVRLVPCVVVVLVATGCSNLGYYAQSIGGHLDLVGQAKPVAEWVQAEGTPAALKDRLHLSQRIREFSVQVLGLPDNSSYRRYADLQRSAAVWNVVATPELSLSLKTWCFPVMGCVGYRGYFRQEDAELFAAELRQQGLEVAVYGVPAYSTLGWLPGSFLSDPLLNTFINYPEGDLARMMFHELSHQVAYADNDTVFNESFATAVERIGSTMWLRQHGTPQALVEYQQGNARREGFWALTGPYRDRLRVLYEGPASAEENRSRKVELMAALRSDYEQLKHASWGGYGGYDSWFYRANNPSLGVLAAYSELVPQFEQVFEQLGGDFKRFYATVRRMTPLSYLERRQALAAAASGAPWQAVAPVHPGGALPPGH
jgi:predicted aminopeptidase